MLRPASLLDLLSEAFCLWASSPRVTPRPRQIATEGVDFLLGRDFHPLVKCTFHGALTLGAHAAQQGQAHLTIYEGVRDRVQGRFQGGLHSMGVKEGGIALAPVRLDFPGKEEALRKVEELRAKIIAGEIQIPKHLSELQGKDTARP